MGSSSEINGKEFIIPILNGVGMVNFLNKNENWMVTILDKLINKLGLNQTFIDVGMNLGQTLLKVKSVKENIHYVGIEPNPFCIHYLNKLITLNRFMNVEILPVGVSDKTGITKLNFFSDSEVGSSASIIEDFRRESETIKQFNVPVFDFSNISVLSEKSILKVDVEGAELEVLNVLLESIKTYSPVILLEILPNYNGELGDRILRQKKIERIADELDYLIYRIIRKNELYSRIESIAEFGLHSDLSMCDYMLCSVKMQADIVKIF